MTDGGLYMWGVAALLLKATLLCVSAHGWWVLLGVALRGRDRHCSVHVRCALAGHHRRESRAASCRLWRVLVSATTGVERLWRHSAAALASEGLVLVRWKSLVVRVLVVVVTATTTTSSTAKSPSGRGWTMMTHVTVLRDSRITPSVERHLRHRVWASNGTLRECQRTLKHSTGGYGEGATGPDESSVLNTYIALVVETANLKGVLRVSRPPAARDVLRDGRRAGDW